MLTLSTVFAGAYEHGLHQGFGDDVRGFIERGDAGDDRRGIDAARPEAYASAEEWSTARDQHTFAASSYARDIAEAEQRVNALREEHTRLLAEVEPLREALWRAVLTALHSAAELQTLEAARIATLHKSLLARLPQEHWHWGQTAGQPIFSVEGAGFHDISKFVATVVGDGFGPDKSAALVAELGL